MSDDTHDLEQTLEGLHAIGELSDEERNELQKVVRGNDSLVLSKKLLEDDDAGDAVDLRTLIAGMTIPEKLKLAMFGNAACRMILIKDPNRMIQEAVLKNPKIQFKEVETFAMDKNVDQQVLRRISDNRTWSQEYSVRKSLVLNPKSPQDVAMKWLRYLTLSDLKNIARSKNVPNIVSTTARKRIAMKKH